MKDSTGIWTLINDPNDEKDAADEEQPESEDDEP
jgi:hypothetical protein